MATGAIRRNDQVVATKIQQGYGHSKYDASRNIPNPEQTDLEPQGLETTNNPQFLNTDPLHPAPAGYPSSHPTQIGELKGQDNTGLTRGIDEWFISQNTILSQMLSMIRAQQPTMPVFIQANDNTLVANVPTDMRFVIGTKPVPALKIIVVNPTGSAGTVWLGLGKPAAIGRGIPIPPGNVFDSIVTASYLSVISSVAFTLAGVNGQGSGVLALQIDAWSNPEWTRAWGNI
jgi:hypothetical protein